MTGDGSHPQPSSGSLDKDSQTAEKIVYSSKGVPITIYDECVRGCCTCSFKLGRCYTQLKPCRFAAIIFIDREPCHDDLLVFDYVVHGVDIIGEEVSSGYECENYESILQEGVVEKMNDLINSELDNGALSIVEDKPVFIHALGAVMKPDGDVRPITDCSRPSGWCLNDHMGSLALKFSYKSVDSVVEVLKPGDYMCVIDIKAAYRSVAVNPAHTKYQGISWVKDGSKVYLEDNRLCFGSRCGPFYFNMFSNFIYRLLHEKHGIVVINYLDDFINVSRSEEECLANQQIIINLLRFCGFFISWRKISPPSTSPVYLGIIIDSIKILRLPEGKLEKMRLMLEEFSGLKTVSKKMIERLAGMLSHCATIIKGGRTFCRSIYNLDRAASKAQGKKVRVTGEALSDIEWWTHCSYLFNGRSTIAKPAFGLCPTSDASLQGFACYLGDKWFYGTWDNSIYFDSDCGHLVMSPNIKDMDATNINVYELFPVYWALVYWGHILKGHRVCFKVDNLQVLYMIRTGRSCNPICMQWLKRMFWLCVEFEIDLEAEYVPSECNTLADTLSRVGYDHVRRNISTLLDSQSLCCKEKLIISCRDNSIVSSSEEKEAPIGLNGPRNTENKESTVGVLQGIL